MLFLEVFGAVDQHACDAHAVNFFDVEEIAARSRHLAELDKESGKSLAAARYQKFRKMGAAAPEKESQ